MRSRSSIRSRTNRNPGDLMGAGLLYLAVAPLAGQGAIFESLSAAERAVDGMVAIREVIAFRELPATLPSIYHGAIRRDVLDELRSRFGRVFPNRFPAIHSGFAIAASAGRFTTVDSPMSVSAQSATSQSAPRPFRRDCPVAVEFRSLNSQEGLAPDPRVPDLSIFPHAPVAEAFLAAKRDLFPSSELDVNRRQLAAGASRTCAPRPKPTGMQD